MDDKDIIDHLSHSAQFYMEIDEPDGCIQFKDGEWEVTRRSVGREYPVIGRFNTLREAMNLALTPLNGESCRALAMACREAA